MNKKNEMNESMPRAPYAVHRQMGKGIGARIGPTVVYVTSSRKDN